MNVSRSHSKKQKNYLLPDRSMRRIARNMHGNVKRETIPLASNEAELVLNPNLERMTSTPEPSNICGV